MVRVDLSHDEPRFFMFETLREYAWERLLESGEAEAMQRQHAQFFSALAEEAEPQLFFQMRAHWLERLEREHDNLRAALDRFEAAGDVEQALRLAAALAAFWAPALGLEASPHTRSGVIRLAGDPAERTVLVNTVPEPRSATNRVHLDLVADSVQPYVDLGAQVLHEPTPDWPWHLLADPEGNQWCVFAPKPGEPSALVADAADEEAIAAWWADVLGAQLAPGPEGRLRWLRDVDGLPWDVWKFVRVPEPRTTKNR